MSDTASFGQNTGHTDSTQPKPKPGGKSVTDALVADLRARREYGAKKYGQELKSGDGRDHLLDAYQEAIDLTMYLKQELMDRDQEFTYRRCWVLADGTCISPYNCPHGDGLPLQEFVNQIVKEDRAVRPVSPGDSLAPSVADIRLSAETYIAMLTPENLGLNSPAKHAAHIIEGAHHFTKVRLTT